eukprot:767803-Hanusia_phi.AAC.8
MLVDHKPGGRGWVMELLSQRVGALYSAFSALSISSSRDRVRSSIRLLYPSPLLPAIQQRTPMFVPAPAKNRAWILVDNDPRHHFISWTHP